MKNSIFYFFMVAIISLACNPKTVPVAETAGSTLQIDEFDFIYFEGKTRISFKDEDKDVNAKATVRIRKDSVIWMSFSSAGITGGKCLIDKDSITILNQITNEYWVYRYDELSKKFNFKVDYYVIQAAALGNLILSRQETDRATQQSDIKILRQKSGNISVENWISQETRKIVKVAMTESSSENTVSIAYKDFQPVENQVFPYSGLISLLYKSDNLVYNTTIEFEYNKAQITDKPIRFPFKIPRKYDRR